MALGKIMSLPMPGSKWARVQDEYGNAWSVQNKELPAKAREGDQFAYRVDFSEDLAPRLQALPKDFGGS